MNQGWLEIFGGLGGDLQLLRRYNGNKPATYAGYREPIMDLLKGLRNCFLFAFASVVLVFDSRPAAEADEVFRRSVLSVASAERAHAFRIEIAETSGQRAKGLQGRETLAADAGMLFDFGAPQVASMWMKDTLIALDMLFIGVDGTIVNIVNNAEPGSIEFISSKSPVKAVLELPGGTARRLEFRPGDRVIHEVFR